VVPFRDWELGVPFLGRLHAPFAAAPNAPSLNQESVNLSGRRPAAQRLC
jgi:hypothetical protein